MKNIDSKKTLQILLVEDSDSDAALLQENIRIGGAGDISISVVKSLGQAVYHLKHNHTDAALLDLTLPDSSGLDTIRQVRNSFPALPIVVLTGVDDEKTGMDAVRLGAWDYLVKGQTSGRFISRAVYYAIERKQAEVALRRSREDLNLAQAVAHIGSWRMNVQQNVLTWSDENHRIFGIPKGTPMAYETFLSKVHPDDRQQVDQKWMAALKGEPYDIEHRIVVDGQIKWVRERAELEFDKSGALLGGFGTAEDITDRKDYEKQIGDLAKFPSESPYPVLRVADSGTIVYANSAGIELLKFWRSKLGQNVPANWKKLITEAFKTQQTIIKEVELNKSVISFAITPVRNGGYANIYGRDITEYKNSEKKLQEINSELEARVGRRTKQLQDTVVVLQNEVLDRIKAEKSLLENQDKLGLLSLELVLAEERERRELATELHDSIGQLLSFSKKELGALLQNAPADLRPSLEKVWGHIKQAVEQTRTLTFDLSSATLYTIGLEAAIEELAEDFAKDKGFKWHFSNDENLKPLTEQFKVLLYRAARELLVNVSKHGKAHNVYIDIQRIKNSINITVKDDGKGFDLDVITAKKGKLKGFGLFSIQERLANIGGSIDIKSQPGHGTTVKLTAPLVVSKGE